MSTDLTFPLSLCKAQWAIWLHTLEMLGTLGLRALQGGIEETRAETDVVMRAEDWQALAMASVHAFWRAAAAPASAGFAPAPASAVVSEAQGRPAPEIHANGVPVSRRAEVHDALRTLHTAVAAAPTRRLRHAKGATVASRRRT